MTENRSGTLPSLDRLVYLLSGEGETAAREQAQLAVRALLGVDVCDLEQAARALLHPGSLSSVRRRLNP